MLTAVPCPCGGTCANNHDEHKSDKDFAAVWSKKGIPHKGWVYYGEFVTHSAYGDTECEMCNTKLKYEHIVRHKRHKPLGVGCVCASHMIKQGCVKNKAGVPPSTIEKIGKSTPKWSAPKKVQYGEVTESRIRKNSSLFKLLGARGVGKNHVNGESIWMAVYKNRARSGLYYFKLALTIRRAGRGGRLKYKNAGVSEFLRSSAHALGSSDTSDWDAAQIEAVEVLLTATPTASSTGRKRRRKK